MKKINTLLIANRGEIACRIIRTAQVLGIRTVAVYSEADANAPHVRLADESHHIGPSPVTESYLDANKIIEVAQASGADAIHPGYGLLSENAAFAQACEDAGITFVGPPIRAIEVMGDKARAKCAMIKAGVPCIPGYQGTDQSNGAIQQAAAEIGFPLMVKAAAGGGGRGMRLVREEPSLEAAIALARSEAENAFGSGDLILEKAILKPRHVEIQVLGDQHGNIIHLGERDCSVQRRHQKVIEEAPSPALSPQLRVAMGQAAIEAARTVDYVGAGTVEFLLEEDGSFYFLEMNTRLQVEHPVTEMITGFDLVALQLTVAEGLPLPINQDDLVLSGHALEVRLYAEDAQADFLPSTGPVQLFRVPAGGGIRVDAGIETGGEISPFYDPMVAKIIAHGASREEARRKLLKALGETALIGPANNRDFLIDAISRDVFVRGEATTAFIGDTYEDVGIVSPPLDKEQFALAAGIQYALRQKAALDKAPNINAELLNWGSAGPLRSVFIYGEEGDEQIVSVTSAGTPKLYCSIGEFKYQIEILRLEGSVADLLIDRKKVSVFFHAHSTNAITICTPVRMFELVDFSGGRVSADEESGGGSVTAPMHGRLIDVFVSPGDSVQRGDRLAVLEAMKMQHEILAEIHGEVSRLFQQIGDQVSAGAMIMQIEPVLDDAT